MSRDVEELEGRVGAELRESAETAAGAVDPLRPAVAAAASAVAEALARGGKLLIAGNGGSAADAQHMAAELVGRFRRERAPAPALALADNPATVTAIANDFEFVEIFSRQVEALGEPGDVLLAISTSGGSPNIVEAVRAASRGRIRTIGLTGGRGGELAAEAEIAIVVGSSKTARIQEVHLTVMHAICEIADACLADTASELPKDRGILSREELLAAGDRWRRSGTVTVWTNGCFDLLHVGHIRFLTQARELGDVLVVGVNSDSSVKELKGPERPIVAASERAEIVASLAVVDAVTIFAEPNPIEILAQLRPDVHCKGGDYEEESLPEAETVRAYGGRVEILGLTAGSSSSDLVQRARLGGHAS